MAFAAVLPLILTAASTAVAAGGAIASGQASANAAKYNAQVARNNAVEAGQAGSAQAEEAGLKAAQNLGRIRAIEGANNIDPNSGSAVKVQEGAREAGTIGQQATENNALLQAYGYNAQSTLDTAQAKQDETAGDIGAGTSLLQGASQLSSKWTNMFPSDDPVPPTGSQVYDIP